MMNTTLIVEELHVTDAPLSLVELGDLDLALVGGGIGETVL